MVVEISVYSVRSLRPLCLCGHKRLGKSHHRVTEITEDAQRIQITRLSRLPCHILPVQTLGCGLSQKVLRRFIVNRFRRLV
jgi:hypothetical protein